MRKIFAVIFTLALFSCDDGDIIVTSFDFDDTNLMTCPGSTGDLFFKFNTEDTESISLRLETAETFFETNQNEDFTLNATANFVNYRIFDAVVGAEYFCNEVPPTTPSVTVEYVATDGIADMEVSAAFLDNDGLDEDIVSDLDSDRDQIPNYYDFDDDGDNVPTRDELDVLDEDGDGDPLTNPLDSDDDGIPDYLDEDDDGDGVLTRYEDADGDLDPTNDSADDVLPNYLNGDVTDSNEIDEFRVHTYSYISDVFLVLRNLTLNNGDETITRQTLVMGTILNFASGTTEDTPSFPEPKG